jgi:hypothetical protein
MDEMADDIVSSMRVLLNRVQSIASGDWEEEELAQLDTLVKDLDYVVSAKRNEKRRQIASVKRMADFIVDQMLDVKREKQTMKKTMLLPGGVEALVRRRARGKCELCGTEYTLSVHHVQSRAEGGLDHEDNLALLCKKCHDRIEDESCNTRSDLLRMKEKPQTVSLDTTPSRADKIAATKAANHIDALREDAEIQTWDKWQRATLLVPILTQAEAARLPCPLKEWHTWVYGGCRVR